jgi:hypothetical protein
MKTTAIALSVAAALAAGGARADERVCEDVRDASYAYCFRANDTHRADCARRCERCSELSVSCVAHCEHYCDAPYFEGCGFDLNGCIGRCEHRCHDPECQENSGCKSWWCAKDNIKSCVDHCHKAYDGLAECRAMWCESGKAKRACLDGCNAMQKNAAACRKSWCGDGAAAKQCAKEADQSEDQCRATVDGEFKTCMTKK